MFSVPSSNPPSAAATVAAGIDRKQPSFAAPLKDDAASTVNSAGAAELSGKKSVRATFQGR